MLSAMRNTINSVLLTFNKLQGISLYRLLLRKYTSKSEKNARNIAGIQTNVVCMKQNVNCGFVAAHNASRS